MLALISCTHIDLYIDNHHLLKNISFSLAQHQHLVLIGPNGAGKTLLLTLLSGNLHPTHGTVEVFGKNLSGTHSAELKKQIGFVSPKLFSDYDFNSSIPEIVMSGLFGSIGICQDPTKVNNKVAKEYINRIIKQKYGGQERALELLEELHIAHLKNETFGQLSQGEKTRVLIARALINNPQLLILDEPTTGLDIKARAEFSEIIRKLMKKATIVYVTHHLEEVLPEFQKVLLLKSGEVFRFGKKNELFINSVFSELLDLPIHIHQQAGQFFAMF